MQGYLESVSVAAVAHGAQAQGPPFRVAVPAALAHLGAADDRVSGSLRRFDSRFRGHPSSRFFENVLGDLDRRRGTFGIPRPETEQVDRYALGVGQDQRVGRNLGETALEPLQKAAIDLLEARFLAFGLLIPEESALRLLQVELLLPV